MKRTRMPGDRRWDELVLGPAWIDHAALALSLLLAFALGLGLGVYWGHR